MTRKVICVMQKARGWMLRGLQSLSLILMLHALLYLYMRLLDLERWLTTTVQISSTPTDQPFVLQLFRGISS